MNKLFLIVGLMALVLLAGFYFQWPAVTQGWPFLIFLLCPLMHLFMGHNHGGGDHEGHSHSSGNNQNNGGAAS